MQKVCNLRQVRPSFSRVSPRVPMSSGCFICQLFDLCQLEAGGTRCRWCSHRRWCRLQACEACRRRSLLLAWPGPRPWTCAHSLAHRMLRTMCVPSLRSAHSSRRSGSRSSAGALCGPAVSIIWCAHSKMTPVNCCHLMRVWWWGLQVGCDTTGSCSGLQRCKCLHGVFPDFHELHHV